MLVTSCHTNAVFQAWIQCEELLSNIATFHQSVSRKMTKVVDECALICMSTFHALKSGSVNTSRFALLCMGICEECAELCEQHQEESFRNCAQKCRQCSESMNALAFTNLQ